MHHKNPHPGPWNPLPLKSLPATQFKLDQRDPYFASIRERVALPVSPRGHTLKAADFGFGRFLEPFAAPLTPTWVESRTIPAFMVAGRVETGLQRRHPSSRSGHA